MIQLNNVNMLKIKVKIFTGFSRPLVCVGRMFVFCTSTVRDGCTCRKNYEKEECKKRRKTGFELIIFSVVFSD